MAKPKPVPEGYNTVAPYLVVRDAAKAIDFYVSALGATERMRMPGPGGSVAHAELQVGDSVVMLSEENLEMGARSPQALGGTAVSVFLYLPEVDAAHDRMVRAGATTQMPPTDMFWGDRFCKLADPFGHEWAIATHIEDVTPEEMERRGKEAFAAMGGAG
jgi:PhnB protein